MALTLIATPGLSTSNSYATAAEGDSYHEGHLYATDWTGATTAEKEAALVMATRLIDQHVRFNGLILNSDQALQMPRQNLYSPEGYLVESGSIPDWLKNATAEFARLLIAKDRTADDPLKGFKEVTMWPLKAKVSTIDRAGVLPDSVWMFLKNYAYRTTHSARGLVRV